MGILGILGAFKGKKADKKKNKRIKQEVARQQEYTNQQLDLSKYIKEIADQARALPSGIQDAYGQTAGKQGDVYVSPITPAQRAVQEASDREELLRTTQDAAIRRAGLLSQEGIRARGATEANTAANDMANFRAGVGQVDPRSIEASIRLDNEGKLNAGYDDAERAAATLQTRTGSSAIGDALAELARDRVRARASLPNAQITAMQTAEDMNQKRYGTMAGTYDMFNKVGGNVYDAPFNASDAADKAYGRSTDAMKFDLSKLDLAMGGGGQAASTIGNAAAGNRAARAWGEQSRIHAPGAKFLVGLEAQLEDTFKKIMGGR